MLCRDVPYYFFLKLITARDTVYAVSDIYGNDVFFDISNINNKIINTMLSIFTYFTYLHVNAAICSCRPVVYHFSQKNNYVADDLL